jgi:hypothetical protein
MTTHHAERPAGDFNLVCGGPSSRLAERLGLESASAPRRFVKIAVVLLVTWVPLALLSLIAGHSLGGPAGEAPSFVPFFHDPEVHARLLFVLPLLELAQLIVAVSLTVLVLAALLPMIPLLGTQIPLREIFMKLGELLI